MHIQLNPALITSIFSSPFQLCDIQCHKQNCMGEWGKQTPQYVYVISDTVVYS